METHEIAAGFNVHIIPETKFKTVNLAILIRSPLRRETATLNALIPQILGRGSAAYDNMVKISEKTERLFGSVFGVQVLKKGEQQIIQFFMEYVKGHGRQDITAECLAFLKEMMMNPLVEHGGFRRAYVDAEKDNLRFAIESRVNNKGEYAKLRLLAEMCNAEPFGVYGDGYAEDLERITPENALAHYETLLRTAPVDFLAVGDLDAGAFTEMIGGLFAFDREAASGIPVPAPVYEPRELEKLDENIGITQGKICMGFRAGAEPSGGDYYRLLLANEIFGGGANSKLFATVREKEGLCYYIHSFVYRFKSIVLMQSGVNPENFGRVEELALGLLRDVADGRFTDGELEVAGKSIVKKFEGVKDNPSAIMDFYITQFMLNDRTDLNNAIEKVKGVRLEDARQAAARLYADTVYRLR